MKPMHLLCSLLVAASAPVAQAALTNCANITIHPADYKVVLDDFAFASTTAKNNPDLAALKDRLQFNFKGQLDKISAAAVKLDASMHVPLKLVNCIGRQPSLNGDEFTDVLAERLSDERVVVEMWGTLDVKSSSGTPMPRALIGYAIPPLQHYVHDDSVPPIQLLEYPKPGNAQAVEDLENLPELPAFALIGLATKAARAEYYDLAVWAFNRAEAGLLDAKVTGSNSGVDALIAYVRRASCLARSNAKSDVSYKGPLKLLPPQICTEAP